MAVTLTLVGRTPGNTQFGLDTFTEKYKCDAGAGAVLTDPDVPQMASQNPIYAYMYVTARYVTETGESASALDLVYTGTLTGILPPPKNDVDNPVQSATTYTAATSWPTVATIPYTVQYRAHATKLTVVSYGSTSGETLADPDAITTGDLISISSGNGSFSTFTFPGLLDFLIDSAYVQYIIETSSAEEIVAGQYWLVTKSKIMTLFPYAPVS